jgi:SAM-dependent methyltransferase
MAKKQQPEKSSDPHRSLAEPSPWIVRFAPEISAGGAVLDIACGHGRHARLFAARGCAVTAIDINSAALSELSTQDNVTTVNVDLEDGAPFALAGRTFDGVIVANYLWRPLFPDLIGAIKPGGVLIYDTFGLGNEKFGRPRNPDHLLVPGELLEIARQAGLTVLAFEHGEVTAPAPAVRQRICAQRN